MAEFFDTLNDKHIAMLAKQPVFFVATSAPDARINLSPKGYDAFRVIAPDRVAYLDLAGSGNETHAHLVADPHEDGGRITIMVTNFDRPALILRIYGRGKPVLPGDAKWDELAEHFKLLPGTRQIFDIAVESVQTSCGWGVPFMAFEDERGTLQKAHRQSDPEEWVAKQKGRNTSIDGLPVTPPDRFFAGD
ncbi:pyridoxamine 5'-phosphate oxidase family protein [Qipengyuania sp. DGS5-3]|uniref:pyridoxamine 5'-phosphate oxidase family protein n=1 Tax=Qipengyuania sp. DGS5-3 TaxID=3349632 RepID=UPI0036D208C7